LFTDTDIDIDFKNFKPEYKYVKLNKKSTKIVYF